MQLQDKFDFLFEAIRQAAKGQIEILDFSFSEKLVEFGVSDFSDTFQFNFSNEDFSNAIIDDVEDTFEMGGEWYVADQRILYADVSEDFQVSFQEYFDTLGASEVNDTFKKMVSLKAGQVILKLEEMEYGEALAMANNLTGVSIQIDLPQPKTDTETAAQAAKAA